MIERYVSACMFTEECVCSRLCVSLFRKTREGPEGCNCRFRKTPRTEGRHEVQGSVDPMFAAGLPFPLPENPRIQNMSRFGKFFQQFSRNFPPELPATLFSSFLICLRLG